MATLFRLENGVDFLTEARELGGLVVGSAVPDEDEDEDIELGDTSLSYMSLFGSAAKRSISATSHLATVPPPPPPGVQLYNVATGAFVSSEALLRRSPTFLLFGSEGRGLDPALLRLCYFHVRINPCDEPATGRRRSFGCNVDSLNVSVASGILLHHFICAAKDID